MTNIERIELLNQLKRKHRYCEDTWYSCPLEESEGCANSEQGMECNCGAIEYNQIIDRLIEDFGGVV